MINVLYNLLYDYLFSGWSGNVEWAELTCTLLSTFGVVLLVALPFLVVWRIITMIVKGW